MLGRWLVGLGALATVACGSDGQQNDEESYRFGAAEVEAVVVGSWTGTWTATSGSAAPLALEVSRQPAQRAACGSRELTEGATGPAYSPQCVSTSSMQLAASFSVEGNFSGVPLTGAVEVHGFALGHASLTLSGTEHVLIAAWSDGSWRECRVQRPNFGEVIANCTLERAR